MMTLELTSFQKDQLQWISMRLREIRIEDKNKDKENKMNTIRFEEIESKI